MLAGPPIKRMKLTKRRLLVGGPGVAFADRRDYFRSLSEATGIRYQTLINLSLRACAMQRRKLAMEWRASP